MVNNCVEQNHRIRFQLIRVSPTCHRLSLPVYPKSAYLKGWSLFSPQRLSAKILVVALRSAKFFSCNLPPFSTNSEKPLRGLECWDWRGWLKDVQDFLDIRSGFIVPAFYFPPQENRGKMAVLLMNDKGTPVAFAKVAWDNETEMEIGREKKALTYLAKINFDSFIFPRLILSDKYGGRIYQLYSTPLRISTICSYKISQFRYLKALKELRDKTSTKVDLNFLPWFNEISVPTSNI